MDNRTIQEYLYSQKRKNGGEYLYHYTSVDAFLSMMDAPRQNEKGAEFLCTNFRFLNDDEEFQAGIELALKWMRDNLNSLKGIGIKENDVISIERLLHNDAKKEGDSYSWLGVPWVLSLSQVADSTAQWIAYSDRVHGGVALGISRERLLECVRALDERMFSSGFDGMIDKDEDIGLGETGGVFLAPCLYYENKAGNRGGYIDRLRHVFSEDERYISLKSWNRRAYLWKCARQIIKQASLLKRKDYIFEHEWRVVYAPASRSTLLDVRFVGGKPRLPLNDIVVRDLVDEVVISHHGDSVRITQMAELVKAKYQKKFKIIRSKSSYVG